jgi:hypothetical protein
MRILSSEVEEVGDGRIRITTVLERRDGDRQLDLPDELGSGPDRDTVPDRVVRFLISCGREGARLSEIQRAIGGNPSTANRQVWSLGNGSPDIPRRLRGWVEAKGDGRYSLSASARECLRSSQWRIVIGDELEAAIRKTLRDIPRVIAKAEAWREALEGDDATPARVASDEALFELLDDARRANTLYGDSVGWEITEANNAFINAMQQAGTAFRLAVHLPSPRARLDALEQLHRATTAALEALPQAIEG